VDDAAEGFCRILMQAHAALGEWAASMAAFERCRNALKTQAGAEPSQLLHSLYADLCARHREPGAEAHQAPHPAGQSLAVLGPGDAAQISARGAGGNALHAGKQGAEPSSNLVWRTPARRQAFGFSRLAIAGGLIGLGVAVALGIVVLRRHSAELPSGSGPNLYPIPLKPRPVVAVLPFRDLGEKGDMDWLSDGITDDLIMELTRLPALRVIDRMSAFHFKDRAPALAEIRDRLGAEYVVEGTLRSDKSRVRANVKMTQIATGKLLWADRFEQPARNWLDIQGDIARRVALALNVELVEGNQARTWERGSRNAEAYEYFLRSRPYSRRFSREGASRGIEWLERAIAADPDFALAYAYLGLFYQVSARYAWIADISRARTLAQQHVQRALDIDNSLGETHAILSAIYRDQGRHDLALQHARKAVDLAPLNAEVNLRLAMNLAYSGEPQEALYWLDRTDELSPIPNDWNLLVRGNALRQLGRHDEAVKAIQQAKEIGVREVFTYVHLVAALSEAGRLDEAMAEAAEVLRKDPSFSVDTYASRALPFKDPAQLERFKSALRQAGLH
jgi:adenylate cyclase